jgi:tetratricopeptide (TPR) repeat protein
MFEMLFMPMILAAGIMGAMAVSDLQSLYIEAITVPAKMQQAGYSPEVFTRLMSDRFLSIEAKARTRTETRKLATQQEQTVLSVAADLVHATSLVRALQASGNMIEFTMVGDVVDVGNEYLVRLRLSRYGRPVATVDVMRPQDKIDELAAEAADRILKLTDPQIMCAAIMQDELKNQELQGGHALEKTAACVEETLPRAQADDRLWLTNLQGVVAFVQGRPEDAKQRFSAALRIEPDFTPSLLNLGVIHAMQGRYDQAIRFYKQVFLHPLPSDSPQSYSATYMEWGTTLMALGRTAEGEEKLRAAIRADPKFASAYFRLAKFTKDRELRRTLTSLGDAFERDGSTVYTENLVGVVQKMGAVAAHLETPKAPVAAPPEPEENDLLSRTGRNWWDRLRDKLTGH